MSADRIAELEQQLATMTDAYKQAVAEKHQLQLSYEAERKQLQVEYDALAAQLDALKRRFFGRSSEKQQYTDQLQLFDEPGEELVDDAGEPDSETTVTSHTRKKKSRKPLPDTLEREEVILDIPEDQKQCGCGHDLVRIGEEVSEKLTIIPARFIVTRYIRPKYACRKCEGSGDEENPAVRIASGDSRSDIAANRCRRRSSLGVLPLPRCWRSSLPPNMSTGCR